MITIEKILKKHNTESELKDFQTKLLGRRPIFGNRISIARKNIFDLIGDILNNEEGFIKCDICGEKFSLIDIKLEAIDGLNLCESCIDNNYTICDCGQLVDNDNIKIFNDTGYCDKCYFIEKQEAYNKHKINNPLIKKLLPILENYDICDIEFKIDGYKYNIENYAGDNYRLGSFSANSWLDIGNIEGNLLQAIDFNLGKNSDKLTAIYLPDNKKIEPEA
jgi:hypothetical protein